jgi:hypothetical protein
MDYAMKNNKCYKLRGGDYILTTRVDDDQLTYRIVHQQSGWVPSRKVAGAGTLMLDFPQKTLREAQAAAEADGARGLQGMVDDLAERDDVFGPPHLQVIRLTMESSDVGHVSEPAPRLCSPVADDDEPTHLAAR